jgi:site-specific recombinase XerD
MVRSCLEEAQIEGYTWHSNRHTFCSWLAMAGASIKKIQELQGARPFRWPLDTRTYLSRISGV